MIPCANPAAQYLALKPEIDAAVSRVLMSGSYVLGEEVAAFEREFASYTGVSHGIGVGSGTDAIHLALRGLGVGAGDEVVTVAHTAVATVAAVEMTGAAAVLVDIDPTTYLLDPSRLASAITSRTRAVVAVHLYGLPADIEGILSIATARGIPVVEDCAQAHGALCRGRRVGSLGQVGCFSFYPTKNLGALGDGGMVVTNDPQLASRVRELREYGWREGRISCLPGVNSRLDEVQAAILRVKLRRLDADNEARRSHAGAYTQGLATCPTLTTPTESTGAKHVYHLYVVRTLDRAGLQQKTAKAGIGTGVHYPIPVHLQPAYRGRLRGADRLPETERAAREVLSLPMFPQLSEEQLVSVVRALWSEQ